MECSLSVKKTVVRVRGTLLDDAGFGGIPCDSTEKPSPCRSQARTPLKRLAVTFAPSEFLARFGGRRT